MILETSLLFIAAFGIINIYFFFANKYNIVDQPNHRSSHSKVTIRGGGIIFPIFMLFYFLFSGIQCPYFLSGVLLVAIVSFWDDMHTISARIRFFTQILAAVLMLLELGAYNYPLLFLLIPFIVGILNGYNFMDGINGLTGLYSLIIAGTLLFISINQPVPELRELYIYVTVALLAFLFYNFRTKAKCFAGDIGSISIAFIMVYAIVKTIIITGQMEYALFLLVYGIDVSFTIIQRLWLKQNIFEAHRMHLYQLLANEVGWSHLKVSVFYGVAQLCINGIIVLIASYNRITTLIIYMSLVCLLSVMYIIVKRSIIKRVKC